MSVKLLMFMKHTYICLVRHVGNTGMYSFVNVFHWFWQARVLHSFSNTAHMVSNSETWKNKWLAECVNSQIHVGT